MHSATETFSLFCDVCPSLLNLSITIKQAQRVRALHCAACGYTAETPHPACRAAGHELRHLQATKRWWRCCGCAHHFATVGVRHPVNNCPKCVLCVDCRCVTPLMNVGGSASRCATREENTQ